MREFPRRLRSRSWVRLPSVLGGILPVRSSAGRRREVTRSASHWIPSQEHVSVPFQMRVLPRTESRKARRAALSEERSGLAGGK